MAGGRCIGQCTSRRNASSLPESWDVVSLLADHICTCWKKVLLVWGTLPFSTPCSDSHHDCQSWWGCELLEGWVLMIWFSLLQSQGLAQCPVLHVRGLGLRLASSSPVCQSDLWHPCCSGRLMTCSQVPRQTTGAHEDFKDRGEYLIGKPDAGEELPLTLALSLSEARLPSHCGKEIFSPL